MVRLHELPELPADWDQRIVDYPGKTLFHESAWHQHLLDIHPSGRMEYFEILDGKEVIGLHCGLRIRKLLLPIHGSPLGGTGTNHMGPLIRHGGDQASVVRALASLLGIRGWAHLELNNPTLPRELMEREGFQVHEGVTNVCRLPADTDSAWKMIKSTARNRIRKAIGNGLTAEVTSSPQLPGLYFEQLKEVYQLQGLALPFTPARPHSLHRQLFPANRILPVQVLHEGRAVASGLFPFDEHCIYYWGGASWRRDKGLNPNELLHWTVMQEAIKRGIPLYNLCGGRSRFKDKFGGQDVPHLTYHKSLSPLLSRARKAYRGMHFKLLRYRGRARSLSPLKRFQSPKSKRRQD